MDMAGLLRQKAGMKLSIGSDHAGFHHKEFLRARLQEAGHEVVDHGTFSPAQVNYPDFIAPAAEAVARGDCQRGIVLGGSGNGEAIVANKVPGIRCALCWSLETARLARVHNDANVIAIGERTVTAEFALEMVLTWLGAEFEGGRHVARLAGITAVEKRLATGGHPVHEKTLLIRPEHLNQQGTLFGGYLMQWADDLAFSAASLTYPAARFVTRRVEAFDFKTPVQNGDIIKMQARVLRLGTTSCTVGVTGLNARSGAEVFSTTVVMVHLENGGKAPVPR